LRIFYGWWVVVAAFLNLFFTVGVVFYGVPVFYPSLVASLHFTRAELSTGFLLGFAGLALPIGILTGVIIDRIGARKVIWVGIWLVGLSLILMGSMNRLWQFYVLCTMAAVGYVLSGPIPNQVLIANWFRMKRGRAMGYAYLGLGLGGAISPLAIQPLIHALGWRHAFHATGLLMLVVLFPVAQWVTKSKPHDLLLQPDGLPTTEKLPDAAALSAPDLLSDEKHNPGADFNVFLRSRNFWLITLGCTLTIGAIGAVTQHLVLLLTDHGYSLKLASRVFSAMLASSLVGRVLVGYLADRRSKKNVMALFYLLLAAAISLLFLSAHPAAVWTFALVFGFALGADYMLIPLLTAECFGLSALGTALALIISGYTVGQWIAPWTAGHIFDVYHSYNLAWVITLVAGVCGAMVIYSVTPGETAAEKIGKTV
jgi:MFS transporter, OFA family, oxalate/formate antiporter